MRPPGSARAYSVTPMGKPRATRRDKWKPSPAVIRYRAFKDACREAGLTDLPEAGAHVLFILPMPKSWSRKKRDAMRGMPHQQVPDADNLAKALMDAVYERDECVWDIRPTKYWGDEGAIIIIEGEAPGRLEL